MRSAILYKEEGNRFTITTLLALLILSVSYIAIAVLPYIEYFHNSDTALQKFPLTESSSKKEQVNNEFLQEEALLFSAELEKIDYSPVLQTPGFIRTVFSIPQVAFDIKLPPPKQFLS